MSIESEYKFECFEEYYGDVKEVKKQISECKICGGKLIMTHLSDYKNLLIAETCRCPECGQGQKKVFHIIN